MRRRRRSTLHCQGSESLIVADHQRTATMDHANLVLPAASFAESDGTLVSQEGRAQRFFQVYDPAYYDDARKTHTDARKLALAARAALHLYQPPVDWTQLDHVIAACAAAQCRNWQGIVDAAPDASSASSGQKLAREPLRYSGRTAMRANISVHEPRQPQDKDTTFAFSMEGNNGPLADRQQMPFAWSPGWNSPQAWNKFQDEVGGKLRHGDPGVRLIEAGEGKLGYFDRVPARLWSAARLACCAVLPPVRQRRNRHSVLR